jgi:hypothetical protein
MNIWLETGFYEPTDSALWEHLGQTAYSELMKPAFNPAGFKPSQLTLYVDRIPGMMIDIVPSSSNIADCAITVENILRSVASAMAEKFLLIGWISALQRFRVENDMIYNDRWQDIEDNYSSRPVTWYALLRALQMEWLERIVLDTERSTQDHVYARMIFVQSRE